MTLALYKSLLRTTPTARLLNTVARGLLRSKVAKDIDEVSEVSATRKPKTAKSGSKSKAGAAPANVIAWEDSVDTLKGVGIKTKEALSALGIANLGQLLTHYPYSAVDRRQRVLLENSLVGEIVTFDMVVEDIKLGYKSSPFVITGKDLAGTRVTLTYFFGSAFQWPAISDAFQKGKVAVISGKLSVSTLTSSFNLANPDLALAATATDALQKALVVEPVYSLTAGLTASKLRSTVVAGLAKAEESFLFQSDWIPDYIRKAHHWPTLHQAFLAAHNPQSRLDVMCTQAAEAAWKQRIAFDRLVAHKLRGISAAEKDLVHLDQSHMQDAQQVATNLAHNMSVDRLRASAADGLEVHQLLELLTLFTGPSETETAISPKAAMRTRAKAVPKVKDTAAAAGGGGFASASSLNIEAQGQPYFEIHSLPLEDVINDPNFDFMNYENDALVVMHKLGIDRDEAKVRLQAARPARTAYRKTKPVFEDVPLVDLSPSDTSTAEPCIILLDLETTGLSSSGNRIIQIAAKILGEQDSMFNAYVLPVGDTVSPFIAGLTGIEQSFLEAEGVPFEHAYIQFRDWMLAQRQGPTAGAPLRQLVLMAHNGKSFDYDFLTVEIERHQCLAESAASSWPEEMQISAFVDSLLILRDEQAWLDKKYKPTSFAQGKLYKHLMHKDLENGHNAKYDILALEEIMLHPVVAETWRRVGNRMQFALLP